MTAMDEQMRRLISLGLHVALVSLLAAIGIPLLANAIDAVARTDDWLVSVAIIAAPLGFAIAIVAGIVAAVAGHRGALVVIDIGVLGASVVWAAFFLLVSPIPLLELALVGICLIAAANVYYVPNPDRRPATW